MRMSDRAKRGSHRVTIVALFSVLGVLILLGSTGAFRGHRSIADAQEAPPSPTLPGFQRAAAEMQPAVIHGPLRLSGRRLARLARRPPRDVDTGRVEEAGEDEAPCEDCVAGIDVDGEPVLAPR